MPLLLWQPQEVWEFLTWPPNLPLWLKKQGRLILPLCLWLIVPIHCACWKSFYGMWDEDMYPTNLQAFLKNFFSLPVFSTSIILYSHRGIGLGSQNQCLTSLLEAITQRWLSIMPWNIGELCYSFFSPLSSHIQTSQEETIPFNGMCNFGTEKENCRQK